MSGDFVKILGAIIAAIVFGLVPIALTPTRNRTLIVVIGFFASLLLFTFVRPAPITLFFESYGHLAGITRGLDIWLADFMLVALVMDRLLDEETPPLLFPRGTVAFVIYISCFAISIVDAEERFLTLFDLITLAKGATVFWVFANLCRSRLGCKIAINAVTFSVIAMIWITFFYQRIGDWRKLRVGNTEHKNVWGLMLNLYAPYCISLAHYKFRKFYYPLGFLGVSMAIGLMLKICESRGAQLDFAGGMSLTVALAWWYMPKGMFKKSQVALLGILVVLGLAWSWEDLARRWGEKQGEQNVFFDDSTAMGDREQQFNYAFQIIDEHKFNGIGAGNWPYYWFDRGSRKSLVHNIYLLTLAECGYVGLFGLLFFMLYWIWISIKNLRLELSPPVRAIAVALPAILIIPPLHCFIEYNFKNYICWISFCVATGFASAIPFVDMRVQTMFLRPTFFDRQKGQDPAKTRFTVGRGGDGTEIYDPEEDEDDEDEVEIYEEESQREKDARYINPRYDDNRRPEDP